MTAAIAEVLAEPHDAAKVLTDAADMRRRLAEAHEAAAAGPWEVKLGRGRMMDIELLAQAGALIHDPRGLRRPRRMLARLGKLGWIAAADAAALAPPWNGWRRCSKSPPRQRPHHRPGRGRRGLVRLALSATGQPDLDTLRRKLAAEAEQSAAIITERLAGT